MTAPLFRLACSKPCEIFTAATYAIQFASWWCRDDTGSREGRQEVCLRGCISSLSFNNRQHTDTELLSIKKEIWNII